MKVDTSGVKKLGVKKPKVKKASAIKSKGIERMKTTTSGKLKAKKEMSYSDQIAAKKKKRKLGKAKDVMDKADQAKRSGNLKKAARLERRSVRKAERAAGKRKTAVGTGLAKAGRAVFGGLAALGGSDAAIRKAGTKGSFYTRKAHEKKKK